MGVEKIAAGEPRVESRDLRRPSIYRPRRSNAYYPDYAYRVDVKRKCFQVLSVVGPAKYVEGVQVESASCFNKLRAEGDAMCIEEYGKRMGLVYSDQTSTTSTFFTAIFECLDGEDIRWVNELPFDAGANELVMSLARHAGDQIKYFQMNISKLANGNKFVRGGVIEPAHTRLSLVLQLDVINCEQWTRILKRPHDNGGGGVEFGRMMQGPAKKQKGVRYRIDRNKWVAEYNPPGKKNNKISLGEYDNEDEAGRAADAGMYCYSSKKASYNFDDSPKLLEPYLAQAPQPWSEDKEAVRKWARDFAKLTTKGSFNSSTSSSWSIDTTPASPSCLSFGNDVAMAVEQFDIPSPGTISNMPHYFSRVSEYSPSMEFDTASSTLHLEEVDTEYSLADFAPDFNPGPMPTQINSSPPPRESFLDDGCFRTDPLDNPWSTGSPQNNLAWTPSDGRMVSNTPDDLMQALYQCYGPQINSEWNQQFPIDYIR